MAATKESKAVRDRRADTEWIKDAVKVQDDGAVTVDYCSMDGPKELPDAYAGGSAKVATAQSAPKSDTPKSSS